jgi:hypothetical protein
MIYIDDSDVSARGKRRLPKLGALAISSFGLICLILTVFLRTEVPLTEKAKRLTVSLEHGDVICWLTSENLLVISPAETPKNSGSQGTWDGQVSLWSYKTGVRTPLPGLSDAMGTFGGSPWLFQPGPDGKQILWYWDSPSADMPMQAATATIDGSNARAWEPAKRNGVASKYILAGWLDATHYFELDDSIQHINVHDVRDASRDRTYRCNTPEGRAIFRICANNDRFVTETYLGSNNVDRLYRGCAVCARREFC